MEIGTSPLVPAAAEDMHPILHVRFLTNTKQW